MIPGVEGVGEAVTGAMIGRAVEPEHGEAVAIERTCLNCGAELRGPYCHQCGQKGHVHRTIGAWWHDFVHSVLHLDGKFWRTLPMLAWRPGELTRRYIEGERARFVSPIAIFLFSVFMMFAVFGVMGSPFEMTGAQVNSEAMADLERESDQLRVRIAGLERQRRALAGRGQSTRVIDAQLAELRREQQILDTAGRLVVVPSSAPPGSARTVDLRGIEIDTGWPRLDQALEKARENPSLLLYKLQTNAYKFSWALIPLSVPFLWLLFLHRRRYRREYKAYDHLVFVTYSIAFMSLLMIAIVVARSLGISGELANLAFMLIPAVHIYRQLRGAYGLSRFSAGWRTFALLVFAAFALTLFLLLLLGIGVLG